MDKNVLTNLERMRSWKGRIMRLGLKRNQVAEYFDRSEATVSRWMHPDKYGMPAADIIDKVEIQLHNLEREYDPEKARPKSRKHKRVN